MVEIVYNERVARGPEEEKKYLKSVLEKKYGEEGAKSKMQDVATNGATQEEQSKKEQHLQHPASLYQLAMDNGVDRANMKYRTSKKYLFFDLEGNLRFEYGGVPEEQLKVETCNGEKKVYELALLVREVREEANIRVKKTVSNDNTLQNEQSEKNASDEYECESRQYFHFYVVGDFWDKHAAGGHPIFTWTLVDLRIEQNALLDLTRDGS